MMITRGFGRVIRPWDLPDAADVRLDVDRGDGRTGELAPVIVAAATMTVPVTPPSLAVTASIRMPSAKLTATLQAVAIEVRS